MSTFLKVLGAILLIWLAVTLIVPVLKGLFWLAIVGLIAFGGYTAYRAIKNNNRPAIKG